MVRYIFIIIAVVVHPSSLALIYIYIVFSALFVLYKRKSRMDYYPDFDIVWCMYSSMTISFVEHVIIYDAHVYYSVSSYIFVKWVEKINKDLSVYLK
jgi:hypothetical protein